MRMSCKKLFMCWTTRQHFFSSPNNALNFTTNFAYLYTEPVNLGDLNIMIIIVSVLKGKSQVTRFK